MSSTVEELSARIDRMEQVVSSRLLQMENAIEDLFYSLVASRLRKKIIEEIVESAVLEFFNVDRKQFLGEGFVKIGRTKYVESKEVIEARKWFLSMMNFILRKSTYSLNINYPFYHTRKVAKHKAVFQGALSPETEKQKEYRAVLLGISEIVKRICKSEGILDEDFKYL